MNNVKSFEEKKDELDTVGEMLEASCLLLDGYEGGLIGYWKDLDGNLHAVYDAVKMIEFYMIDNKCSYEDALENYEYNCVRSLPYVGENERPIIIHQF